MKKTIITALALVALTVPGLVLAEDTGAMYKKQATLLEEKITIMVEFENVNNFVRDRNARTKEINTGLAGLTEQIKQAEAKNKDEAKTDKKKPRGIPGMTETIE